MKEEITFQSQVLVSQSAGFSEILINLLVVTFQVAVIVWLCKKYFRWKEKRKAELESARIAYSKALSKLSEDSSKSNKVAALEAGRHYADVARGQSGLGRRAIFDEVAMQNDLSAYGD